MPKKNVAKIVWIKILVNDIVVVIAYGFVKNTYVYFHVIFLDIIL